MPCYSIQTYSVEFKAENEELLERAINTLGWRVLKNVGKTTTTYSITTDDYQSIKIDLGAQKATIQEGQNSTLNKLKRAYSMEALKVVAKKKHWTLKVKGENKGVLLKRQ